MKKWILLLLVLLINTAFISTPTTHAATYYYKWNGYSGNSYQYVTSKTFVNAVKQGKITVNGKSVEKKVTVESLEKSSDAIMTYAFENRKVKSKYIKRQYDAVYFLNDKYKTYGIDMPVKKGKITKKQFIKTYGKRYSAEVFDNESSVYYKFKNHYFEGTFNKKNQLISISFSSHIAGKAGKEIDEMIFGK